MTFSYSGDPSASDIDEVRFHVQDTDSSDPLISDEEIQFLIDQWADTVGTNMWVAAMVAENLAAKFAREVAVSADGVSVAVEQLQDKFEQLAVSLRDRHKSFIGAAGSPTAGGTLFDETFDLSIKPLSFGKGMHDNMRAGRQDFAGTMQRFPELPEDALD